MKKRSDWFPASRPQQLVMFTNVKQKIDAYKVTLPLATDKVVRIILICDTFIALYNYVEQTRATVAQLTDYQNLILTADGGTQGEPAPAVPVFQTLALPSDAFVGIFEEFRKLVEDIKTADNYTRGIGEDLMIVAPEGTETPDELIVAAMKVQALPDYKVRVEGSLQKMQAMRIDWRPKAATAWRKGAGYLTKLPGEITIEPTVAGAPESGELRCVLIEKNEEIGQYSPNYPITIS